MRVLLSRYTLVPLLLVLAACTHNPLRTAQTSEQFADATYGGYVIAKEQGAALLSDASIPDEAKRPLAELMVSSKPVGDAGQQVLIQYSTVKAQVAAGTTPEDQLRIVEANIKDWIAQDKPIIDDLIAAVGALLK